MKKILRFTVFILAFLAVFIGTYNVLSWKDTSGDYLSTTKRLYETKENTIDVLFTGSSHCYCSILPYILWDEYGMSAFSMATSGQDRESTYYHIKEVLKTQSPKVVCVDLGAMVYDGYLIEGNLYRNMLSMKLSKNNLNLINVSVEEGERADFITRWPIIHTRYNELTKFDFVTNEFSIYGRGEGIPLEVNYQEKDMNVFAYKEIGEFSEDKKEWINRIIKLSEDEGFELIFYNAPFRMDLNQKGMYNAINQYLEQKEIPYFDFNQRGTLDELNYETDFVDHAHTNIYGGTKITKFLGLFLSSNYILDNHKGDIKYNIWEQDATYCKHYIQAPIIKNEPDWNEYINYILNSEDLVVILSLDGDYENSPYDFYGMLVPLEIESGYRHGGKWIIENGEVIQRVLGDDMEPYIKDLGADVLKVQNIEVKKDPSEMFANIMMNGKEMGRLHNGFTVLIYDKILKKVIDVRCYY